MRANYHTHTWRCNHATGTEEEYVKAAIAQGFDILGFSDHTPQFFPEGYRSGFRMEVGELADYCAVIRNLRDRYSDSIRIPMGLEAEYYPALFSQLIPVLRDQGVEYLRQYCKQSMDAMQTGLFTYFAHPDLLRFEGDDAVYRQYMRRLCQEAKSCDLPLEMNLLF